MLVLVLFDDWDGRLSDGMLCLRDDFLASDMLLTVTLLRLLWPRCKLVVSFFLGCLLGRRRSDRGSAKSFTVEAGTIWDCPLLYSTATLKSSDMCVVPSRCVTAIRWRTPWTAVILQVW